MERIYTFADGTDVLMAEVPSLVIEHILNNEAGKPSVPVVEVVIRGHKRKQTNPDDPDYQAAVERWQQQKQKRLLKFLITKGVQDDPPEDFIEEYAQFLPDDATPEDFKYLWLAAKLDTDAEIARFTEALMSQTTITEGGLEEAAAKFPGDSGRDADRELALQEPAIGED